MDCKLEEGPGDWIQHLLTSWWATEEALEKCSFYYCSAVF